MRIIIPMAGMGKRMRPHTLSIPKPLFPIAGKPIIQRLVEEIYKVCNEPIEEIAYIIGDFGQETEKELIGIAENIGAKASIYYQEEALGTAHAILCAADSLEGNLIVAFADTLFKADFELDKEKDGIIWVHKIEDPSAFGVVKLDENEIITDFIEKPSTFISDLAIIGIYYFKDGLFLRSHLQHLIDNDIKDKGEYQITNALENMKNEGRKLSVGSVNEWLDCGNKDATIFTNQRILEHLNNGEKRGQNFTVENSVILEPCFIGDNAHIRNSVIGPYVSISADCKVESSVIKNSIIKDKSIVKNLNCKNSIVGSFSNVDITPKELSVSDHTSITG
jgi:glucose-1-phosphate thymidylyltransferase